MIRRLLGQRVGISGRWHLMSLTFIVALLLTAAFDPRVKDEPNTEQGNQGCRWQHNNSQVAGGLRREAGAPT